MTRAPAQNQTHSRLRNYVPWVATYLFIIGAATAFGVSTYEKYNTHQLPSGHIELVIDKTAYQLGEPIAFTVINHFPVPVFVLNQCPEEPLSVYRWENNTWTQLHATAKNDGECRTEERKVSIPSDGSRGYNFDDWPDLFSVPGVYRISAHINHYPDTPFQDFAVLAPAEIIKVVDPPQIRYVREPPPPPKQIIVPPPILETQIEPEYEEGSDGQNEEERYDSDESERDDNND